MPRPACPLDASPRLKRCCCLLPGALLLCVAAWRGATLAGISVNRFSAKEGQAPQPIRAFGEGEDATQFVLDACPAEAFHRSVAHVSSLLPGALEKLGGIEKVVGKYRELSQLHTGNAPGGGKRCRTTWMPSTRNRAGGGHQGGDRRRPGLIINLGAGTTGTRFLDCVVGDSFHLRTGHKSHKFAEFAREESTEAFDRYDYISDSPVPYRLVQLLLSHPGDLTAGVLLSLRDPFEWVESRVSHHGSDHCCAVPTVPCGRPMEIDDNTSKETFVMHFFLYQAWAACLGSSPQLGYSASNLFAFNVFEQLPANLQKKFYRAMRRFAPRRQSPSSESPRREFERAWEECRS